MCGLNGIFAYHSASSAPAESELIATRDAMRGRGPDGSGVWWSSDRRCALGHRRLSILDLSERASQPMISEDGQLAVVFNGEIYNYPVLRKELEADGVRFRTTSDTETLLHLYARCGAGMVHRLRGMFALAIWDEARRGIFVARDPYGIKPLYTANDGWTFRFASQVKALLAGHGVSRDTEPAGVVGFHLFGSVPEPFTLYREIRALPAGHTQWVDAAGPREPRPFANLAAILAEGARSPSPPAELPQRVR
ncbi:MAG: asparagine synthetase B, partial [Methyloceanibacter sp.]